MRPFVVVGSGPSAAKEDLEQARGRALVIAVNESWRLCPWAEFLYSSDHNWWHNTTPEFDGIAVGPSWGARRPVEIVTQEFGDYFHTARMMVGGRNSGLHAVNLAYHLGATRVGLVGFDMHDRDGKHWHSDHARTPNPTTADIESWRTVMDDAAHCIAERGMEVVNCSLSSALTAYPKMTLSEFICL